LAADWEPGPGTRGDAHGDGRGGPTAVVGPGPDGTLHRLQALVVAPSAAPSDVLTRAMARPAGLQHASVVCTDSRGRVLGTMSIASLVDDLVGSRRGGLEVAR
ncbi:hypothetical protein, partial [Actinotalea sp. C106]|uniref:hypothetical protein n=1 Tax=Actinotalea sp. C106 TaxID=2908644 RepID=UPI0020277F0C